MAFRWQHPQKHNLRKGNSSGTIPFPIDIGKQGKMAHFIVPISYIARTFQTIANSAING